MTKALVLLLCAMALVQATELDDIKRSLESLKHSLDSTAKEEWNALQSLRISLLSVRKGLKIALDEVKMLRDEVVQCHEMHLNFSLPAPPVHVHVPSTTEQPVVTTPAYVPLQCDWPSVKLGERCIETVTDMPTTWEEAMDICRNKSGRLAGEDVLDPLRRHLTEEFGINSDTRVRWSVWVGAKQTLSGWEWANSHCSSTPVAADDWAANEPHPTTELTEVVRHCMSLDGFNDYKGKAAPCTALRRFVCDVTPPRAN